MQRFRNQANPGPVRRPTQPTDKLSRRRAGLIALLAVGSAIALTGAEVPEPSAGTRTRR